MFSFVAFEYIYIYILKFEFPKQLHVVHVYILYLYNTSMYKHNIYINICIHQNLNPRPHANAPKS